jgi:hypothetical protein
MYELIFEILPWSLEDIQNYDNLFKLVVMDKKRPKIPENIGTKKINKKMSLNILLTNFLLK